MTVFLAINGNLRETPANYERELPTSTSMGLIKYRVIIGSVTDLGQHNKVFSFHFCELLDQKLCKRLIKFAMI